MAKITRVLLLLASSLSLPLGGASAADSVEAVRLTLKELKPEDAFGILLDAGQK